MGNLVKMRIEEAREGRLYWLSLKEKYKLDAASYVLLIPDKEDIVHLKESFIQYISSRQGNKGIIIADNSLITKVSLSGGNNLYYEACAFQESENLIRFYSMYQFTSNLLIASLEKPDGRRGEELVGKIGFDRKEVLDMVVFGIEKEQEEVKV